MILALRAGAATSFAYGSLTNETPLRAQPNRSVVTPHLSMTFRSRYTSTLIHSLCINLWMTVTRELMAKVINRTR
jgi:hypothetical protein